MKPGGTNIDVNTIIPQFVNCHSTNLAKTALANDFEHGEVLYLGLRSHGESGEERNELGVQAAVRNAGAADH